MVQQPFYGAGALWRRSPSEPRRPDAAPGAPRRRGDRCHFSAKSERANLTRVRPEAAQIEGPCAPNILLVG